MDDVFVFNKVSNKNINKISIVCIIMLFVFRIPLLGLSKFIFSQSIIPIIYQIFIIGTYLFTALFIWLERDKLSDYHMDAISIIIFTLGPLWFLYTNLYIRIPMIIVGLFLLISLFIVNCKLPKITIKTIMWIIIGILAGTITTLITNYFSSKQISNVGMKATFAELMKLFLTQLTNAAILEEPFFRGCLWGFLRKMNCKEFTIYLVQVGLFWLGHIYYINTVPYSFWILVPLSGLVLGFLAWRSRSIGTSMVTHGVINGLGQFLSFYKF
jgi:membrane protease YdiL (CAAX protease family)